MSSPPAQPSIIPASLFSLAIYNPSLGPTDETVANQIVFFTSREPQTSNDRLRQVGLAQGVVEFARGFNKNENLSHIETEQSRIVLQEVESGWWILAHIDFTRIISGQPDKTEYSSREVSHPRLLLAQILSAYNQYCFLHGTFESNIRDSGRERFCRRLERYWAKWARRWEVRPTGNPAVEIWGGINMPRPSLGVTVREVLEAFVAQERGVEGGGLVDMVVSRFGKAENPEQSKNGTNTLQPESSRVSSALPFSLWSSSPNPSPSPSRTQSPGRPPSLLPLAFVPEPEPTAPREITTSDGCILAGTGHLDPTGVRDITTWASNLYLWNEDRIASRTPRGKKGKRPKLSRLSSSTMSTNHLTSTPESGSPGVMARELVGSNAGIENIAEEQPTEERPGKQKPPSLIHTQKKTDDSVPQGKTTSSNARETTSSNIPNQPTPASSTATTGPASTNGKLLNMLTFGWAGGSGNTGQNESGVRGKDQNVQNPVTTETNAGSQPGSPKLKPEIKASQARFLYGYIGDLEDEGADEEEGLNADRREGSSGRVHNVKITEKNVWLLDKKSNEPGFQATTDGKQEPREETKASNAGRSSLLKEFRVVVYLNPPFTFILIFEPKTPRLSSPSFYRSLHLRLGPLRNSLLPSIPKSPRTGTASPSKPTVYNVLYDRVTLTVESSLPNIPSYPLYADTQLPPPWTRADALHIHYHIINTYADSERGRERKSRTTRGWWLAYERLGSGRKEGFLAWKGVERGKGGKDRSSGQIDIGGDFEGGAGMGGILDTRRYFEGLLRGRG